MNPELQKEHGSANAGGFQLPHPGNAVI